MKKVLFIKNTLILTVTALLLRSIGIVFRIWLTGKIGAEGIGLYQIVFSVYILASTFASTGICTAVTRVVTERLAAGDPRGGFRAVRAAVLLSLLCAGATAALLRLFGGFIAVNLLAQPQAEPAIRILPISLPFLGASACVRGYFTARRRSLPGSLGQILEQLVRIAVTIALMAYFSGADLGQLAAVVMLGDCAAEAVFTLFILICYRKDKTKLLQQAPVLKNRAALREIFRISFPISAGRYLHTALRTVENVITPLCLAAYAGAKQNALSQFGAVKGMALPLLLFPASLLSAVSTLLVPEITEAAAKGNTPAVQRAVQKVFGVTMLSCLPVVAVFFCCSGQLGLLIYQSSEVGWLLRALAPLIPFMYLDLITDGILKGLDQQKALLRNCVIDSALRIILVLLAVPRAGMLGFLGVMFFSNIFTTALALVRIKKVTKAHLNSLRLAVVPFIFAAVSGFVAQFTCAPFLKNNLAYTAASTSVIGLCYLLLLVSFGYLKPGKVLKLKKGKTKLCCNHKQAV